MSDRTVAEQALARQLLADGRADDLGALTA